MQKHVYAAFKRRAARRSTVVASAVASLLCVLALAPVATAGAAPGTDAASSSLGAAAYGCTSSVSPDGKTLTTWCPPAFPNTRYQVKARICGTSSCQDKWSPTYRLGSTNSWAPGGYVSGVLDWTRF